MQRDRNQKVENNKYIYIYISIYIYEITGYRLVSKYNLPTDPKSEKFLKLILLKFYFSNFNCLYLGISYVLLISCSLLFFLCVALFYSLPLQCILHTNFQAQFTVSSKEHNSWN